MSVPAPASMSLPAHVVAYRAKTQEFYRHAKDVLGPLAFDAPNHDVEYERGAELGKQADVAGDVVLDTPAVDMGRHDRARQHRRARSGARPRCAWTAPDQ